MRFFVSGSRPCAPFALALALAMIAGLAAPSMAIDIAGPDKIEAYRLIDHSTPNPAMWEIEPSAGVDMRQAADGMSITWVAPPGTYKVAAIIVLIDFDKRSWSIQKAAKEVVVGNPPSPPEPAPTPGAKYQVAFLIESGDLDNLPKAQQALLASLTLRDDLARRGHYFVGVLERDQAQLPNVPAALAPFYAAVEGDSLPRIAIAPLAGGDVIDHSLPADQAALFQLLGDSP